MFIRSCVLPEGKFAWKIHAPAYRVANFRKDDYITPLGVFSNGAYCENRANFPPGEVEVSGAPAIVEIFNLFPFRGVTYINKTWADENAADLSGIRLPAPPGVSLHADIDSLARETGMSVKDANKLFDILPEPLALALAQTSTDPDDLVRLAEKACEFVHDPDTGRPKGLKYEKNEKGRPAARISRRDLFEVLANNPHLPEDYRLTMVLRPGVQGESEIVGEWKSSEKKSHVFEYLRSNSYIPWGHYAANMADDAVRYRIEDLSEEDMTGMRHLYYQRTFTRIARDLGLGSFSQKRTVSADELEVLRNEICQKLADKNICNTLTFNRTLWGWNFGFDFSPSRYRLHASHQQVHQQYAMIPSHVDANVDAAINRGEPADPLFYPYACGDQIESFLSEYHEKTGVGFFDALVRAIRYNTRMDGREEKPADLVVYSDENVMLFVPKAQTSQWELNLMTVKPVGNIVEANQVTRKSVDYGILTAARALSGLGARMITSIEYSKRIDSADSGQRLFYSFLPRLPHSPGAFSEAQLRWINGHYPEDFAEACRAAAASFSP